jgi:ribosomal subunit interface protein
LLAWVGERQRQKWSLPFPIHEGREEIRPINGKENHAMQVSVSFRSMEPVAALRTYAKNKISKLKRFLGHPLEAKVVLAREKHRQRAEVTLTAHRVPINACGVAQDMFGAIDLVIEKLERQILKEKEKVKRPKLHSGLSRVRWGLHDNGREASAEGAEC